MEIIVVSKMPSRSEYLRDLAWECRQVAGAVSDAGVPLELLLVAERFELLAQARDSEWRTKLPEAATADFRKSGH